jgi:hypothetical protein
LKILEKIVSKCQNNTLCMAHTTFCKTYTFWKGYTLKNKIPKATGYGKGYPLMWRGIKQNLQINKQK